MVKRQNISDKELSNLDEEIFKSQLGNLDSINNSFKSGSMMSN